MVRWFSALSIALALLAAWPLAPWPLSWAAPGGARAAELQTIEIATAGGTRSFSVELANTRKAVDRGLMYRKSLPDGQGMLFDFGAEKRIEMWMENTFIPLDMVFIGADGRIRRIAENTKPLSRRLISSGGPIRAVLEINAGTVRKLGIAPGDLVSHPMFATKPR
jgi:uncharacterized membrane protein (UPF0127 family)